MASSGIVLNGSTATWTITAADCAKLPLGTINVSLLIWYGTRLRDTITGTINVRDTSLGAATTTATWSSTLSVAANQTSLVSGSAFTSTLTFTNAGSPVSPTFVDWRLSYQPQGSTTPIAIPIPAHVVVSGVISYTQYVGHVFPFPTAPWVGATVTLYDQFNNFLGTTTTAAGGIYDFIDATTAGTVVFITVDLAVPPGEVQNERGQSSQFPAVLGDLVINLTCTGGG